MPTRRQGEPQLVGDLRPTYVGYFSRREGGMMDRTIKIEISPLELMVLKKLVLINAALAQALTDPMAAREQAGMVRAVNEIVLRADVTSKVRL
jgi:hypothetical protein